MGVWGAGIFQDDTACDIRDEYKDLLGEGLSSQAAKTKILNSYASSFADPDESGVAWLALAAIQSKMGRMDEDTLSHALRIIDSDSDLARWKEDSKAFAKRKMVLEKLREQLALPQPPEKRVSRRIPCKCPWRLGDVFAYRLLSDQFLVFQVVGHHTDRGGTYPVCKIVDWIGKEIPSEEMLKIAHTRKSRADYKHKIYKLMLVGFNRKCLKRIQNLDLNLMPFHKRILNSLPGAAVRIEREPASIVHFKYLDNFLKEWFLIE